MLAAEWRCLDIADGMAQRGDPLTMEQIDKILRNPQEQRQFLADPWVDPTIRERLRSLVEAADHHVEDCHLLWAMKWFVMQCRLNPAWADRAERFWSFTAPRLPDPLPSVADLVGLAPWYTGERSTDERLHWTRRE